MYGRARTGFTLALLLVVAVLCLVATLWVHRGFRARSTPAASEAYIARKIRNFAIPTSERRSKNALDATADNVQQARELFIAHCASCHGLDGGATHSTWRKSLPHKNRMQGNDFVQSVMYTRGITCFDCHDAHGTTNYAQLRKPAQQLCLDCHGPQSPNGPRTATLEEHSHHKQDSPGSQCIACHMPQIETEGPPNTFVRSHTFKFISPSSTTKYKIPNPCNSCHQDKSPEWAAETVRHWNERSPWRVN